tara:strand:- start:124 stop:504 length:381 start_codon:yes stop_codon:yes gene_type:complete
MTDSAGTNPVPGTEVTTVPGVIPETIGTSPVDPAYAAAVDYQVDTMGTAPETYPVPEAQCDPHCDEIQQKLDGITARLDELLAMAHSHHSGDHQHPEPPPVLYEGHVVLHPTSPPPPEAYDTATGA